MLTLYNTLTRKKEVFTPFDGNTVRMYHCGPTVYDHIHIGNLRAFLFADILRRAMEYEEFVVKQVMNITDEDDKIENRAKKEGKSVAEITKKYEKEFFNDLEALNIKKIHIYPRATEHIIEQIGLIKTLEKNGYTYLLPEGIYFNTSKYNAYGELALLDEEGLKEGARVEPNINKKNPSDFVLWKFPGDRKRERIWDSPWGKGFPGWHIECSAMAMKYLGETLDIHTGGVDLIPTHHTNEKAQSECATGKPFARFWMHNAFVNVESGKMSKSEGTGITLNTLRERELKPLAYRYFLLSAHYRTPITFSWDALDAAQSAFSRLHKLFFEWKEERGVVPNNYSTKLREAIEDDINTPQMLALLFDCAKDGSISDSEKKAFFLDADTILGLKFSSPLKEREEFLRIGYQYLPNDKIPDSIRSILKEREVARKNKKWYEADALRNKAQEMGYSIDDTETGQRVYKIIQM